MFRKYYKAANDDIKPNRELIDKIFEKAEVEKSAKKVFKFRPGYGTAIAAVLVLIMGIAVYPRLNPVTEPQVVENISSPEITPAEIKSTEKSIEVPTEPKTESEAKSSAKAESSDQTPYMADAEQSPTRARTMPAADAVCEFFVSDIREVSEEETYGIQVALRQKFGEVDSATGNRHIFEIAGKSDFGGETMYVGRWRWWVKDHSSLLCEFVLNADITEMYECQYTEDGIVRWTMSNNLLD